MSRLTGDAKIISIARELMDQIEADGHILTTIAPGIKRHVEIGLWHGDIYRVENTLHGFRSVEYSLAEDLMKAMEEQGYNISSWEPDEVLSKALDIWEWENGTIEVENICNDVRVIEEATANAV